MSELTKKRVHWYEEENGEVTHDEDVDVLTSADCVTCSDGMTLQEKLDKGVYAKTSELGDITGLSTANKSSLVDSVNEVVTRVASNERSIQIHSSSVENPHNVTKEQVGLGNCDNTSDVDKPVSTAQQTAINNAKNTAISTCMRYYEKTIPANKVYRMYAKNIKQRLKGFIRLQAVGPSTAETIYLYGGGSGYCDVPTSSCFGVKCTYMNGGYYYDITAKSVQVYAMVFVAGMSDEIEFIEIGDYTG